MDRAERLDDREESLRLAHENAQAQMWTALPGIVIGVDLAAQTCTVQPAITGEVQGQDGQTKAHTLPLLADVPIVWPRAGGFAVTFPVRAGDECLVVFACRCIDGWWQSGAVSPPAERRMHDLSDGFAILAPTSQKKALEGVSSDAVQMRTEDGSAFVSIDGGGNITLKTPAKVQIQAGELIALEAPQVTMTGAITTTGNSTQTGNSTLYGTHTVSQDAVIRGRSFMGHVHTGVQPGSSNTGTPA